jgi:hypothetical protein
MLPKHKGPAQNSRAGSATQGFVPTVAQFPLVDERRERGGLMSIDSDNERRLLGELGVLSDRLRALRAVPHPDSREIRPLESQMSLKWQEMRLLRAGPVNTEAFAPGIRSHYR